MFSENMKYQTDIVHMFKPENPDCLKMLAKLQNILVRQSMGRMFQRYWNFNRRFCTFIIKVNKNGVLNLT